MSLPRYDVIVSLHDVELPHGWDHRGFYWNVEEPNNTYKRDHYTIQDKFSTLLGDLSSQQTCSTMYCSSNQTVST